MELDLFYHLFFSNSHTGSILTIERETRELRYKFEKKKRRSRNEQLPIGYICIRYMYVPQIHIENDVGKCDLVAGIEVEMIICRFDDVCYIHMYFSLIH